MATFPKGLFSWVNRQDNVNFDYAEDPNALAGEIIAVETALGANPQIEKNPPVTFGGTTSTTYPSVDARISDALNGGQVPVVSLRGTNVNVPSGKVITNAFGAVFDPFNMFNGQDLTIPCNGWWMVSAFNNWASPRVQTGFSVLSLTLNGISVNIDVWRWDFPNPIFLVQTTPAGTGGVCNLFPGYFTDDFRYKTSPALPSADTGFNKVMWQGLCHAGDRFSVLSGNGTTQNPHPLNSFALKASFLRSVSGTFTSG